ncbi:MAG: chromosomal replication initiator protein DnaA [Candidatus Omnitrophica bacterium]|nr:chromosomal replication initiator protein DnaA [Candidatus Omnitrophota bacterium]
MEPLDLNLWNQALACIQRELPSQAYETWFQPTRAVSSTGTSLIVEVPSPFFRDWISSHYTELIDRILGGLYPSKVRIEFTIASQTRQPLANLHGLMTGAAQATATLPEKSLEQPEVSSSPVGPRPVLNPRYVFEQFVIGPSNRFAHAAALAVSESPAKAYNPLFIYGGVGLGKTHLMQAIGHRLQERFPQARCIYLSSERFTNQLIGAIQNRTMASFRDRFRSADVLMIDDIQFIGGKESTQEGFFHTFNALYDAHKQLVISSDRPPKELRGVEERLVSRFEWGLVTDIHPPDLETRVAILRKKAAAQGQEVPDDVTLFIAERVSSNIRELEGALNRVIAYSVLVSRGITLGMAQETLKGMVAETAKRVTLERIQRVVASYFNLTVNDIRGKRRTKEVALPRQVAMALSRELTEASLLAIGEAFGGRDHATVLYACQRVSSARGNDPKLQELLATLVKMLGENCE